MGRLTLRVHKTKAKRGPLYQRTQDNEMSVRASSCTPCRMTYKSSTHDYVSELYHEMCTHVLQAPFEEKDISFKCCVSLGSAGQLRVHSEPTARRITWRRQTI